MVEMSNSRDFVLAVIDLYKELPCLWKSTDAEYHDKVKRNLAMDQLVDLFKTVDPSANKDLVMKKLSSMRGSFRK